MERFALVTGTSRGLGLAVAHALLARRWHVLGIARSAAPGELASATGYRHLSHDLADVAGLARRLEGADAPDLAGVRRLGLVNNAARLDLEPTDRIRPDSIASALLGGVAAPAWLRGWALRAAPRAAVRIVDVSSGAATAPYPGWSAYCQQKAALDMGGAVLGEELAELPRLRGRDVAVVAYAPGVVDTGMQTAVRAADPDDFPRRERFVALQREGKLAPPEAPAREIADLLEARHLPPFSRRRYGG